MIRPLWDIQEHLTDEVLAVLADHGPNVVSSRVLEHMAGCADCTAAWALACETRGRHLRDGLPAPVIPRWRQRNPWAMPVALTAMAALVAFVLVIGSTGGVDPFRPDPLLAGLVSDASAGGMIFPGVENVPPSDGRRMRSADNADPAFYHYLDNLGRQRLAEPADLDVNRALVAGWVVAGQVRTAAQVVRVVREIHPEDQVLMQLAAIVAWRESRLEDAEALLRTLHTQHPGDQIISFNLALLLQETGRPLEADTLLDGLPAKGTNPAVQSRLQDLRPIS